MQNSVAMLSIKMSSKPFLEANVTFRTGRNKENPDFFRVRKKAELQGKTLFYSKHFSMNPKNPHYLWQLKEKYDAFRIYLFYCCSV